jgi:hypothetical protein
MPLAYKQRKRPLELAVEPQQVKFGTKSAVK